MLSPRDQIKNVLKKPENTTPYGIGAKGPVSQVSVSQGQVSQDNSNEKSILDPLAKSPSVSEENFDQNDKQSESSVTLQDDLSISEPFSEDDGINYHYLDDDLLQQNFGDFMDTHGQEYTVHLYIYKINYDVACPFLEVLLEKLEDSYSFPTIQNFKCSAVSSTDEDHNPEHTQLMNECIQKLLGLLPIHDIFGQELMKEIYKGFIEHDPNTLVVVFDLTGKVDNIEEEEEEDIHSPSQINTESPSHPEIVVEQSVKEPLEKPEPEGTSQPKPEGPSQPEPEGTSQPEPEGTSREAPEGSSQPAPESSGKSAPENSIKPEPEGPIQPAPESSIKTEPERPVEKNPPQPFPNKAWVGGDPSTKMPYTWAILDEILNKKKILATPVQNNVNDIFEKNKPLLYIQQYKDIEDIHEIVPSTSVLYMCLPPPDSTTYKVVTAGIIENVKYDNLVESDDASQQTSIQHRLLGNGYLFSLEPLVHQMMDAIDTGLGAIDGPEELAISLFGQAGANVAVNKGMSDFLPPARFAACCSNPLYIIKDLSSIKSFEEEELGDPADVNGLTPDTAQCIFFTENKINFCLLRQEYDFVRLL